MSFVVDAPYFNALRQHKTDEPLADIGGASIYGLVTVSTGPPLLRQENQEIDPRQNPYTRSIMEEHDKVMRDLQKQQSKTFEESLEVGRKATGS